MKNTILLLLSLVLLGCKTAEKVTARPVFTPRPVDPPAEPATFSITTETTQTANGEERTIVFREAGDMTSTNKVKAKDLENDIDIKKLKDKLKKDKKDK